MEQIHLAIWRRDLEAKGSSWNVRSTVLIDNDLLILGADENDNSSQLFICNLLNIEWSSAQLNGTGPSASSFYCPILSESNERLFVFWPKVESGLCARLKYDYENTNGYKVTQDEIVTIQERNNQSLADSENIYCITQDDQTLDIPRSYLEVLDDNNNFEDFTHVKLDLSVLNFAENMHWTNMSYSGNELPIARNNFTCTRIGRRIYLFGGVSDKGVIQNDVYIFDLGR